MNVLAVGESSPLLSAIEADESNRPPSAAVLEAAKRMLSAINGEGPALEPVTVWKRADGTYEVLDGHDTLQAAKVAGWTKVAIRVIERH
jgi:ParB-like chromosome segregation protein Spo0J